MLSFFSGADQNTIDNEGETALTIAGGTGEKAASEVLKAANGRDPSKTTELFPRKSKLFGNQ